MDSRYSRAVRIGVVLGLVPWLALAAISADLYLRATIAGLGLGGSTMPSGPTLTPESAEALSLNHRTLSADLVWIQGQIYYGERMALSQPKPHLLAYAQGVATLDPRFYPVYDWFASTWIADNHPPTSSHLAQVSDFLDMGMRNFPTDPELPYRAALNYIGYSADRAPRERLVEIDRALGYLQRAAELDGANEQIPFLASWFHQRRRQLLAELSPDGVSPEQLEAAREQEIALYVRFYLLTSDAALRERLAEELMRTPEGQRALYEEARAMSDALDQAHRSHLAWLPIDSWTSVSPKARAEGFAPTLDTSAEQEGP